MTFDETRIQQRRGSAQKLRGHNVKTLSGSKARSEEAGTYEEGSTREVMRFPRPHRLMVVSVCSLSRQLGVGQATANDLRHSQNEAVCVGERIVFGGAIVVAERLLICIALKVERLNCNVSSIETTLQKAPEVLYALSVDRTTNILVHVANCGVNEFLLIQSSVSLVRIGEHDRARTNVIQNLSLKNITADMGDNLGANLARITLQHSHDNRLVLSVSRLGESLALSDVHVLELATDKRLIHFYRTTVIAAHLETRLFLHGFANTMQHEPCRLLSHADRAVEFIAGDSVLAIADHPDRCHPLVQTDWGILKDRADLDGELLLAAVAEPKPTGLHKRVGVRPATRASNLLVRPAERLRVFKSAVRVREVNDCLLESYGSFHGLIPFTSGDSMTQSDLCVKYVIAITFVDPRYAPKKMNLRGKPTPQDGWYFVAYEDGYQSFSPAKQFEEGNTPEPDPRATIGVTNNQSFHSEDLANWFSYHAPSAEQLVQYGAVRAAAREFADVINLHVPGGADKSAAMRLVREAMMTANAGIACHKGRPTIAELEKILATEDDTPVTIQPDGSITAE